MLTHSNTTKATRLTIYLIIGLLLNNPSYAESLLIRDVYIVSSNQSSAITKPQNVLIKDGQIAAIGQPIYPADKQLQGNGQFLSPGFIDSHVHLSGLPGVIPVFAPSDQNVITEAEAQIPKSYLYFGFTTVLDLASMRDTINEWNKKPLRPDAYHCVAVPIPNGYPLAWDKENQYDSAFSKFILYDKRQAALIPKHIDPEQHSARNIVKRIKDDGALCIKIYYETGFGPLKNLPVPNKAMVNTLTTEARKHGLLVFMHGNSEQSYRFGLDTDIDILAHGMWHWDKLNPKKIKTLQQFAQAASKSKIAFQPTIQVLHGEVELFNPHYFNNKHVLKATPAKLLTWYQSENGQWMKNRFKKNIDNLPIDPLEQYQKISNDYKTATTRAHTFARLLADANATLIFGSDTPSGPFYTQFPGINGYLEIQRWSEAGISLDKIFKALTIDNAKHIGLSKELGSIQVGKKANLLLLKKNPLKTIDAYNTISTVILNGTAIQRSELSALSINID